MRLLGRVFLDDRLKFEAVSVAKMSRDLSPNFLILPLQEVAWKKKIATGDLNSLAVPETAVGLILFCRYMLARSCFKMAASVT